MPSTPTNIVSVGNTYHSLKVLVTIAPDVENISFGSTATFNSREFEYQELNICHDGTDVSLMEFGRLSTSIVNYLLLDLEPIMHTWMVVILK